MDSQPKDKVTAPTNYGNSSLPLSPRRLCVDESYYSEWERLRRREARLRWEYSNLTVHNSTVARRKSKAEAIHLAATKLREHENAHGDQRPSADST